MKIEILGTGCTKCKALEEAVKKYSEKEYSTPKPLSICLDFARFGAKWQAERMYNEDDLLGNGENSLDTFLLNSEKYSQEEREITLDVVSEWIKQRK